MSAPNIETIVSLAKRRGFVFPSSEIYGGLGSAWDYGPLGVELCNSVKLAWWRWMVHERDDMEGIDSSIVLNRLVWKYSGHEDTFSDPLVDCRACKTRLRADKLDVNGACPNCGSKDLTESRPFNLMFRTSIGATADENDESALVYLRPETAQGIFINFHNVLTTIRRKIPFGIAQIGKSFRNEVTPGNFIFRTREFEQMEMEYFVRPGEDEPVHQEWIDYCYNWFLGLGVSADNLRFYEQPKEELAHYAKRTVDIHYRFFLARYDDAFNARAFGDLFQLWGTSTVLIESGALPDDPEKQRLRDVNVVAILTALEAIATGGYRASDPAVYESLPVNDRSAVDVVIVGATLVVPGQASIRADIAMNYDDALRQGRARVREMGDLSDVVAFDTVMAAGLFVHVAPAMLTNQVDRQWLRIGAPVEFTIRKGADATSEVVRTFGGR